MSSEDFALGVLAFDPTTPHEGSWASTSATLTAADYRRMFSDAKTASGISGGIIDAIQAADRELVQFHQAVHNGEADVKLADLCAQQHCPLPSIRTDPSRRPSPRSG